VNSTYINMKERCMQYTLTNLALAAALGAATLLAPPAGADDRAGAAALTIAQAPALAEGEIRKVDKEAKKLTIKHGPIANLDMPPMTMVFQVKDPALLDRVKAGDKVKFRAEKEGGAYLVTSIEK
jgi:Cu/Ag efflux protein CusF